MEIHSEIFVVVKLVTAITLGGVIGYDRERHGGDAGIRTYAAVCMGAALFTAIASHIEGDPAAPSRIIANIVTGVGFIGAGIIYKGLQGGSLRGLTTAATIWATSAIGVAIGLDMYVIAVCGTAMCYFLLTLHHRKWYANWKTRIQKRDGHNSSHDQ